MPWILAKSGGMEGGISVERLTDKHYKKDGGYFMKCSEWCEREETMCMECERSDKIVDRLGVIEDILGDDYDLERLRELVEADREGRCHIGRCVECSHYEGLAVCEFLGDCGGTNWICGWFEPRQAAEAALKGEQNGE